MMRKITCILLGITLLITLTACGSGTEAPTWQEQYDLGVRYLSEGNYEEAIIAFTAAIEIDPKRADAYIGLADVYTAQGNTDAALEVLSLGYDATGDEALRKRLAELEELIAVPRVTDISLDWRTVPDDTWMQAEYAVISGLDEDGAVQWTYESGRYPMAQLQGIEEIGLRGDQYYFNECGTITVLDQDTGEIVWKNADFGGASISSAFCDDGTLVVCGSLGPDFCAIDPNGRTLARIESFENGYYWPYQIEVSGDQAIVTMEMGPDGYDTGARFHVNLRDWSFGLMN